MVLVNRHEFVTEEERRLRDDRKKKQYWKKWGPYVAERQWATVREDYSHDGDAWSHFSHEQSRSRAYRWGEDGIAGVCDTHGRFNIAFSFWNEQDAFLKERLFGLSNPQGNHGESVKEAYFHVDNIPSHAYMKFLYKYPQNEFPYEDLIKENGRRTRLEKEYNIADTGIFEDNAYWDIIIETAKEAEDPDSLIFRVTAWNRNSKPAKLHIIPQAWFRNTWSWGRESEDKKPSVFEEGPLAAKVNHHQLGERYLEFSPSPGPGENSQDIEPQLLFTENESNFDTLGWGKNKQPYVKDGFHRHIVDQEKGAVNPQQTGTKAAAWYAFNEDEGVLPGECAVVRFRFSQRYDGFVDEELIDDVIEQRKAEADEFYSRIDPMPTSDDMKNIQRQAFAGMLWCKQYYHFIWDHWANGDPGMPPPPPERKRIRNEQWKHMYLDDILSMPDSWEYPFFAAWDTAFHCIPLAMIDPEFAKKQLDLFTREWYMHPNGQLPAYEWNFGDVNPPVHAWSVFRTFKIERKMYGHEDMDFLERTFQKLLLNFTWWVNRKDTDGKNIFEGGFLGLDNIGVFNRSEPLPTGGVLEQADSTGWMGFYCVSMLNICLELAKWRRTYEDMATKFFEHFILISDALRFRTKDGEAKPLWNEEDGFYYDAISWGGPHSHQMPVRSLVGLIPLYATCTLEPEVMDRLPFFKKRVNWFIENNKEVAQRNIANLARRGRGDRLLLALCDEHKLKKILVRMLDEDEFLADHGIRSLSKYHKENPYSMTVNGQKYEVAYLPGDSDSGLFGGNSNWRGPIWMAVNFLLVESLLRFYMFYGETLKVECPTGSGDEKHLGHVAEDIQHRLTRMFMRNEDGRRPINGGDEMLDFDPNWRDYMWFYEFFDGDSGRGLGATHQCGWTGLIAKIIHDTGVNCAVPQTPRTPSTAAAHYFDDVFARQKNPRRLRRSSTARSLGAHQLSRRASTVAPSEEPNDDEERRQRKNSVGGWNEDEKQEEDDRVAQYVLGQMERIKMHGSADEMAGEVENHWQSDGNGDGDYFQNGNGNGNGKSKTNGKH